MENTIEIQSKIYKHIAWWPIAVLSVIGVVADPDAGRSVVLMLILFTLLAFGIVGSGKLAFGAPKRAKQIGYVGYGGLCLLYVSGLVFIVSYHILRLSTTL
ncbi:hypothetical protein [Teredinibacter sp. KSP-S5-2]|uniref:hypothetical protein n=1 Tax=Teredinibacter sp. KSP-S5-2 TaxID=3034506 RepID=UPI002934A1E7|nr:hypothetical protein [Teredinibacter sp. KSP-S5-2]WNO08450.1 hypothetical protein P5V12_15880 [Teredinibacter sp. KSP-S5-2]